MEPTKVNSAWKCPRCEFCYEDKEEASDCCADNQDELNAEVQEYNEKRNEDEFLVDMFLGIIIGLSSMWIFTMAFGITSIYTIILFLLTICRFFYLRHMFNKKYRSKETMPVVGQT